MGNLSPKKIALLFLYRNFLLDTSNSWIIGKYNESSDKNEKKQQKNKQTEKTERGPEDVTKFLSTVFIFINYFT